MVNEPDNRNTDTVLILRSLVVLQCNALCYCINLSVGVTLVWAVYRSGTVNSKSFVGKVLLRIKRKFELTYAL